MRTQASVTHRCHTVYGSKSTSEEDAERMQELEDRKKG